MKRRHKRITFIVVGLAGVGLAACFVARARWGDLSVFFVSPRQVAAKEAPVNRTFRIGGLVQEGTLKRDGLNVQFIVTDTAASVPVVYNGILPDLFKEGRGCVAQGKIGNDGVFRAEQVLAKHDENYMPPEAGEALDHAKHAREAAKTVEY